MQDVGQHLLRSCRIGQVGSDGHRIVRQLSGLLLECLLVAARDGHPGAGTGEAGADDGAEAPPAAGDECTLPE